MTLSREADRERAKRRRTNPAFRAKENERRTAKEFLKDATRMLSTAPMPEVKVRERHFAPLGSEHSNPIRLQREHAGVTVQKYGGNRSTGPSKAVFDSWSGDYSDDEPRPSAIGEMLNQKLADSERGGAWFLETLSDACSELTRAFITHALSIGKDRCYMRYPVEWDWEEWWRGSKATWQLRSTVDIAPTLKLEDELDRIAQHVRDIQKKHPSLSVPVELRRLMTRAEKREQFGRELERIANLHRKYSAFSMLTNEVGGELTPKGRVPRIAPEQTVFKIAKLPDDRRKALLAELFAPVNLWASYSIAGGVLNGHLLFSISPLLVDPATRTASFPILMYVRPANKLPLPTAEAFGNAALSLLVDGTTAS